MPIPRYLVVVSRVGKAQMATRYGFLTTTDPDATRLVLLAWSARRTDAPQSTCEGALVNSLRPRDMPPVQQRRAGKQMLEGPGTHPLLF